MKCLLLVLVAAAYANGMRTICDYNNFTARLIDEKGCEVYRREFK